jgi:probable phosphoglycerate mutase
MNVHVPPSFCTALTSLGPQILWVIVDRVKYREVSIGRGAATPILSLSQTVESVSQRWPEQLWIVRHGQSAGNVVRDSADATGKLTVDISERDVDVPLSALGFDQARALGHWFNSLAPQCRPTVVLTSPYLRAQQTVACIAEAGGLQSAAGVRADERIREREFGIIDRLTRLGIAKKFPEQAAARERQGKFYYRPPGGESWCDVILRLRTVLDTISLHHSGRGTRVLIVAHQVVVLCLRYLLEGMSEEQILRVDHDGEVVNCGVTEYRLRCDASALTNDDALLQLVKYNFVVPGMSA